MHCARSWSGWPPLGTELKFGVGVSALAEIEVEVGAMAAGGGCVAKVPDGRVMFVRHAIPGERVRARVTQEAAHYLRADAVEIIVASPDRVVEPCSYAGPGRCGGCDWQHIALPRQRQLKAGLVAEQLRRLAHLDLSPVVQEVAALPSRPANSSGDGPGGPSLSNGLGWRTRARFAVDQRGRLGFRRYRSHEVEPVARCLIATAGVEAVGVEQLPWAGATEVGVLTLGGDTVCHVSLPKGVHRFVGRGFPNLRTGLVVDGRHLRGPRWLEAQAAGRRFRVSAGSFWQVHEQAPDLLAQVVLDGLVPAPGESVVDLYAGVGLFAAVLAERVGRAGSVLAVERDPRAYADALANTSDLPQVRGILAGVTPEVVATRLGTPDLVVLDPPRSGAGPDVMAALASLRPSPRCIAYVSCHPASFARDVRVLLDRGWTLADLQAFDLFPMTEHVELVGFLVPGQASVVRSSSSTFGTVTAAGSFSVRRCAPDEVRPLRQAILRPHQRVEDVGFAGDGSPDAAHFCAAETAGHIVGVASVVQEPPPWPLPASPTSAGPWVTRTTGWRLRGMAAAGEWRGRGVGSALMSAVIDHVAARGGGLLWCNARLPAVGFYEHHGLRTIGDQWEEPFIGSHVAMWMDVGRRAQPQR